MSIIVLPLNAAPNTKPALARQLSNFGAEIVRDRAGATVNSVSLLVRVSEEPPRFANVNPSEALNEAEMIGQFFEGADSPRLFDGLLAQNENGSYTLTYRFFERGTNDPIETKNVDFTEEDAFPALRQMVTDMATHAGASLPEDASTTIGLFGTENSVAFLRFLEGFDALQYIERSQGQVAAEFVPELAMDLIFDAIELDPDWEAPYLTLLQLCRVVTQLQIGQPEPVERYLNRLTERHPDDWRGFFSTAEFYDTIGNYNKSAELYEKASGMAPEEPAILTRLGLSQMNLGMPANAERSFRRAMEIEGDDKPSADLLANVLTQTGRAHEVPGIYRDLIATHPDNPGLHAKLGMAHFNAGELQEARVVLDNALNKLEDTLTIKRVYAAILANSQDFDRAMDFYEDYLDQNPTDIQVMIEYYQTLEAAGRHQEIPQVLRDILNANPDPNTRAEVMARLIEHEQPKRVQVVAEAQNLMQMGDVAGAVKQLRPLRNWLSDYWKLWAMLSSALNRMGEAREAEDAATRLINMYPGCEPAYGELVIALGQQERHDEAYNLMRYARSQMPNSLGIAINYALAAKRAGHADEARELGGAIRNAVADQLEQQPELAEVLREIEA